MFSPYVTEKSVSSTSSHITLVTVGLIWFPLKMPKLGVIATEQSLAANALENAADTARANKAIFLIINHTLFLINLTQLIKPSIKYIFLLTFSTAPAVKTL
jgi:hypothetical protein